MNERTLVLTILGMVAITVVTRSFFFLSRHPWRLPDWTSRGLVYAPVAALCAVIAPEIALTGGHWLSTWQDARLFAVAAALAWYRWRGGVLGTIVVGMAIYLPLHVAAGW